MKLIKMAVGVLMLAWSAHAQITNCPATAFENTLLTPDVTIQRGSSFIGRLASEIAAPVEVRAEQLTVVQTSKKASAVILRSRIQHQTNLDYIDYDELDSMLDALNRMQQNENGAALQFETQEISFRTRGGFAITRVQIDGKPFIALKSPGSAAPEPNLMNISSLPEFQGFISSAKAKLDAAK